MASNMRIKNIAGHLAFSQPATATTLDSKATAGHNRKAVVVCVTGAAGNIAYSLIFQVAAGMMLGKNQPIELRLLDIPQMVGKLKGVEMEIQDCAFPLLTKVVCTSDYKVAFSNVDVALLVGARPRGPGMDRADLLAANASIFSGQGKALNQYASRDVKVVVVGNPANTNALIAMTNAPNIPKENFTALTRLDHNRAIAQIAARVKVPITAVKNVIIWGNHSNTQYPDINHAIVTTGKGTASVRSVVKDDKYLNGDFISTVQLRGGAVIKARQLSSAASAANAVVDHMRDWILGTPKGSWVSMAIPSDGSYGVPKGVIYSFPVTCSNGKYKIVQGLKIDEFSRKKMDLSAAELLDEKKSALK